MARRLWIAVALALVCACELPGVAPAAVGHGRATRIALKALKPQKEKGLVVVFSLPRRVATGKLIYESAPGLRTTLKVCNPVWLYWEDLAYGAMFSHPSRLLLVDATNGRVYGRRSMSFELAIGSSYAPFLRSRRAYAAKRYRVYASPTVRRTKARGAPVASASGYPGAGMIASRAAAMAHECFIPIGDFGDPRFAGNLKAMQGFAQKIGIPMPAQRPTTADELHKSVDAMTDKGCADVFIYVTGDGTAPTPDEFPRDGKPKQVVNGIGKVTDIDDVGDRDVPEVRILNKELLDAKAQKTGKTEFLMPQDLVDIAAEHKFDAQFKIKIDACYSGRFKTVIEKASNVRVMELSARFNEISYGMGTLYGNQPELDPSDPAKVVGKQDITALYDAPDGATFFTNANVHGLYQWAMIAPPGASLLDGITRSFGLGQPKDPAAVLHWTHPQQLIQPLATPTFKISSTLSIEGSDLVLSGNSSDAAGGGRGTRADVASGTPISALRFAVPPAGNDPRRVTNFICPTSLPSAHVETTTTDNDTLVCDGGSLPVGQAFQLHVQTQPPPTAGMGGQVYAVRAGTTQGPFAATGP